MPDSLADFEYWKPIWENEHNMTILDPDGFRDENCPKIMTYEEFCRRAVFSTVMFGTK